MIKICLLLAAFAIAMTFAERTIALRRKRYLVYPKPESKVQMIIGTGIPVPLERHAVTMGWVLKANYFVPVNVTKYTESYVTFQKRSLGPRLSRYDLYRLYEAIAGRFGVGGKECTLRSICEASQIPFEAAGLLGRILRIFLLPSSTDDTPLMRTDMDYHGAEALGKDKDADCKALYPSCALTLTDMLTIIT